jgi:hypothetical protein
MFDWVSEVFVQSPRSYIYTVQGHLEHFTQNTNQLYIYKSKCQPESCPDCPLGSYCSTCKECKVNHFTFEENQPPMRMLECECKKNLYEMKYSTTYLDIDNSNCVKDISNCDGKLKGGTCFNSSFYTYDGQLK